MNKRISIVKICVSYIYLLGENYLCCLKFVYESSSLMFKKVEYFLEW